MSTDNAGIPEQRRRPTHQVATIGHSSWQLMWRGPDRWTLSCVHGDHQELVHLNDRGLDELQQLLRTRGRLSER